jgi:predicted ArsR family transcriptional regulator
VADSERRADEHTPTRAVDVHRPPDAGASLERLLALGDSTRRDLYFFVVGRGTWVSRKEAAEALELRPGLVAHHLDRLVDEGLLEIEYRRLTGRSGPGAGRPAKLYRRTDATIELTIPPRNPRLVNQLLIEAVGRVGRRADPVRQALVDVAREAGVAAGSRAADGAEVGERSRAFTDLLGTMGYAPHTGGGELSLANCPYEPIAEQDRQTVCSMNLGLVEGAVAGVGLRGISCSLRPPAGGGCCVHVAPWPTAG